jgi:hypothetical protein
MGILERIDENEGGWREEEDSGESKKRHHA